MKFYYIFPDNPMPGLDPDMEMFAMCEDDEMAHKMGQWAFQTEVTLHTGEAYAQEAEERVDLLFPDVRGFMLVTYKGTETKAFSPFRRYLTRADKIDTLLCPPSSTPPLS